MNRSIEISIPKPCHEDWRKFTPTSTGGFCQACQKEVIDFTRWTDQAIVQHFDKANTKTCGRFQESQLRRFQPKSNNQSRLPIAALLALAALGISKPAEGKAPKQNAPIEQRDTLNLYQTKADTLIEKIIITGTILDEEGGTMPGVNVLQKGTDNVTVSDGDGKFMLVIKHPAYVETLQFTFIGMVTVEQQVVAINTSKSLNIVLQYDAPALDGLVGVVGGAIRVRRFSPRWIWWKVRGVFSRSY
jgi:hypothetical protein